MANSVVKVTDAMLNDSLLLLVGEDGTVTPDRETVESYLNSKTGATNIQLMHINKSDEKSIDISVDNLTYIPDVKGKSEPTIISGKIDMDEISRNLYSFKLDHDYTPLTSPSCTGQPEEIDELAKTLEMLDGGGDDAIVQISNTPTETKTTKLIKLSPVKRIILPVTTASIIPLSTSPPPLIKTTSAPIKQKAKVITTQKAVNVTPKQPRQKPKIVQQIEDEFDEDDDEDFKDEDYEFEDDDNDSDFEIEGVNKSKISKKKNQVKLNKTPKLVKLRSKGDQKTKVEQKFKVEIKPEPILTPPKNESKPVDTSVDVKQSQVDKKLLKKEKKAPKPILDDFALFSTPDIIRRVGKEPSTPSTPDTNTSPQPAKINSEQRSKSASDETSIVKPQNRLSIDVKLVNSDKNISKSITTDTKNKEKRLSSDSKPKRMSIDEKNKTQDTSVKSKPIILQNIQLAGPGSNLEPVPSADDIRAIINEEGKSTFTPTMPLVQGSEISSSEPNIDQNINLDAAGLELDQSILDNINNDMISEDILYQVAKSLVGNTDLQNAIDKGLNEGNLLLDPSIQQAIDQEQTVVPPEYIPLQQSIVDKDVLQKGTQIVRPDGRIVVIPPIERPTTRSRNKKEVDIKPLSVKPLDSEHLFGIEIETSGEEEELEEDESEDDPNKLWCICNQPHNNRFMICCDTCEEWYHGKCVNITKAMGQQMEQEGREWICLFCKDPLLKRPQAAARRIRKASRSSRASADSTGSGGSRKAESNTGSVSCIVCQKPARKNSVYCSETCILAHAQGVERIVVFERSSGKMLSGNKAPSSANLEQWLRLHPGYEVYRSGGKVVTSKQTMSQHLTQSKLKLVKNTDNDGISLAVQKKGVKVGILKHLPKNPSTLPPNRIHQGVVKSPQQLALKVQSPKSTEQQQLIKVVTKALTQGHIKSKLTSPQRTQSIVPNPKVKSVQTTLKVTFTTAPSNKDKTTPNKDKTTPNKTPKSKPVEQLATPQPKQENKQEIRENVQKTLFEQLTNRLKLAADLKLSEEEVKSISTEIESQLYKCFGDTSQKYRNKYRSLIFNIKDVKNQTLWRRICEKSVNPYQLVRLSSDDLASQELARWREREAKHQLEMIKKSEIELLNCSRQYVLKTHKGEQVLEDNNKDKVDHTDVIRSLTEEQPTEGKESKLDSSKDFQKKNATKHNHRDKMRDRKSGKDRERTKNHRSFSRDRDRSKRRSQSRDRSSLKQKDSKRSKSRDRDRHRKSSHKNSRYRKEPHMHPTDKLGQKSLEILEQLVDNNIVSPFEDRLWKHVSQEDIVQAPVVESDSDHEPSSTVTIPTPPHSTDPDDYQVNPTPAEPKQDKSYEKETETEVIERSMSPPPKKQPGKIWKGTINMIDVAQISISAHEVSGDCSSLGKELPSNLDIVGRISPDTVWDYIGKMKCSNSKIISLVRLNATNIEEKMPYLALYSYLSSRNRLGVVKSINKAVKDFYILPLGPQKPIPQALLPLNGPGFEESRPALLLGIIVRDKRKRPSVDVVLAPSITPKKTRIETPPLPPIIAVKSPPPPARSYTPPPVKDPRIKLPLPPPVVKEVDDGDEPYSPEDSDPDSSGVIIIPDTSSPPAVKFVEKPVPSTFPTTYDNIPGLDNSNLMPSSSLELQRQMEEINKKIEMQKSEIHSISKNIATVSTEIGTSALANIALPSNLQQILDSLKTIGTDNNVEETPAQAKVDPNLTIPLMLPTKFARPLNNASGSPATDSHSNTIPLNLPTKVKLKHSSNNSPQSSDSTSVLSSLTEEELVRKAAEMLGETEIPMTKKKNKNLPAHSTTATLSASSVFPPKRAKFDITEPPIPGVDDNI